MTMVGIVVVSHSRRLAEDWREERAALAAYRKKMKAAVPYMMPMRL